MTQHIIGIKLADGSFYPILAEGEPAKKVLELTTVNDGQTTVQVNLYRSPSGTMSDAEYVDTLLVENLNPHDKETPTLTLHISLDDENTLSADIKDEETGGSAQTAVSLVTLEKDEILDIPDYEVITSSGIETADFEIPADDISALPADDFEISADRTAEQVNDTFDIPTDDLTAVSAEEFNIPVDEPVLEEHVLSSSVPDEPALGDISALPDFDIDLPADDMTTISNEDFDIPADNTAALSNEDFDIPTDSTAALSNEDFDIPADSTAALSNEDFDIPADSTAEQTDDLTSLPDFNDDFNIPDDNTLTDSVFPVNDQDFSIPAESSSETEESTSSLYDFDDDFDSSIPSPSISFSDLYDEQRMNGQEEAPTQKTSIPMIICIICAVICTAALLLMFVFTPAKSIFTRGRQPANVPPAAEQTVKPLEIPEPVPAQPEEPVVIKVTEVIEPPEAAKENEIVPVEAPVVVPAPPPPPAPAAVPAKPAGIRYKIKWGDTLWDLAGTYYKNPWLYKKIARANGIKNPDLIISGTYITIPPK